MADYFFRPRKVVPNSRRRRMPTTHAAPQIVLGSFAAYWDEYRLQKACRRPFTDFQAIFRISRFELFRDWTFIDQNDRQLSSSPEHLWDRQPKGFSLLSVTPIRPYPSVGTG